MRAILSLFFGMLSPLIAGELTFEETLVEVTLPVDGRKAVVDFKFENRSGERVDIARYEGTCSCMSVQVKGSKLSYAPGEGGVIRGVFDMANFSGTVSKALQIWLKGDPDDQPSLALTARIHIPVLVSVEPKTLRWDVGGNTDAQVIQITMNHDEPIHVKSVECINPHFTLELEELEAGRSYRLRVEPKDTAEQRIGLISIKTDCKIKRHAVQRAFTTIRKPVANTNSQR